MRSKKYILEKELASFSQIRRWIKKQYRENESPILIEKGSVRSEPFRVWPFANSLLLLAAEGAKTQSQQIMSQSDWDIFCGIVKNNFGKGITELDGLMAKELDSSWRNFIPSFRYINDRYNEEKRGHP